MATERPPRGVPASARRGLTLTEVLLCLGLTAMLILLLAPSSRRVAGRTMDGGCLNNLRNLGVAVGMYTEVYKGVLPGPVEPAIRRYVDETSPAWQREQSLTWLLRDVLGDVITEQSVTCPVAARINPDANFEDFHRRTGRDILPTHYCLNSYPANSSGPSDEAGFRTTSPALYFGLPGGSGVAVTPRRIDEVANQAKEWMIADAWYRPRRNFTPELEQEGPYQYSWTGWALPNFAPHYRGALRNYHFTDRDERSDSSAEIRTARSDGETNTLFFDGHAAAVGSKVLNWAGFEVLYGFPGTVNPESPLPPWASWVDP